MFFILELINILILVGLFGAVMEGAFRGGTKRMFSAIGIIVSAALSHIFLSPIRTFIVENSSLYTYVSEIKDTDLPTTPYGSIQDCMLSIIAFMVLYVVILTIIRIIFKSTKMVDSSITGGMLSKVFGIIGGVFGYVFYLMIIMGILYAFSFVPVCRSIYDLAMQVKLLNFCMQHNLIFTIINTVATAI